jgi:ribosomal protein S18 acetylase RimI-like enzyme
VTGVAFRRARAEDVAAIAALLADDPIGRGREGDGASRAYAAAFAAIESDPNQYLLVAEREGTVAGCLQLTFIPGLTRLGTWRGQIEGVRVASGSRGEGLGERMLSRAVALCRDRGCGLVQLTTDKRRADAVRFYQRLGFVASHEGMKLSLNAP